jgi:hypothetical protein
MKRLIGIGALCVAALVAGCGGGDGGAPLVAASDTVLPTNGTTASAVAQTTFTFDNGVAEFGTNAATDVKFTSESATPAFSISSGGNTATGTTTFGSCDFHVTASSFPVGHPLAQGQTVIVNPCNLKVNTAGATANGVAASRSVALLLGAAYSAKASVTVAVTAGGQLTLNGSNVGLITLTPLTGS